MTFAVGAWGAAGAVVGAAIASIASVALAPAAFGGAGLGMLAGWVAVRLDAARRGDVAGVLDARGDRRVGASGWVLLAPILFAAAGLAGLAVHFTARTGSPAPALIFGGTGLGVLWAGRRAVARARLERALAASEQGRVARAVADLTRLQATRWVPAGIRRTAHLNLGLLALRSGAFDEAARWLSIPGEGAVAAFARPALALTRVLQGRYEAAERLVRGDGGTAPVAADQADAVRVLLLLRRDGPDPARALGEQLLGARPGDLLVGLVAWLRWKEGDVLGASALLDPDSVARIEAGGLTGVVAELGEVVGWRRG